VLFVGNSLTYVGNLPAVFSALAEANGRPMASDMIVKGGATLAQRVADGSVEKALEDRQYTALVLQERGGDLMCSFSAEPCEQSRQAIKALVALAKEKKVHVVLLGTYQSHPAASRQLSQGESSAAADAGIPYIEISEKLQHLRGIAPELAWFAADGIHPGKDLALLNAVLLHKTLRGTLPSPQALTVRAPIYGSTSGLTETLRQAIAPPPLPDTPSEVHYSSDTVEKLLSRVGSS
jgi:proteasome lid subunit RPN8/RPN11